jgi:hypothetical protein
VAKLAQVFVLQTLHYLQAIRCHHNPANIQIIRQRQSFTARHGFKESRVCYSFENRR